MVSVPAINKSRPSAESSSMLGLVRPFSVLELSAAWKIVKSWPGDVEGRASNSKIRSRDTFHWRYQLLELKKCGV